jgi:hypothetical protein
MSGQTYKVKIKHYFRNFAKIIRVTKCRVQHCPWAHRQFTSRSYFSQVGVEKLRSSPGNHLPRSNEVHCSPRSRSKVPAYPSDSKQASLGKAHRLCLVQLQPVLHDTKRSWNVNGCSNKLRFLFVWKTWCKTQTCLQKTLLCSSRIHPSETAGIEILLCRLCGSQSGCREEFYLLGHNIV